MELTQTEKVMLDRVVELLTEYTREDPETNTPGPVVSGPVVTLPGYTIWLAEYEVVMYPVTFLIQRKGEHSYVNCVRLHTDGSAADCRDFTSPDEAVAWGLDI